MYTRIIQPIMDSDALQCSRPVVSQRSANSVFDPPAYIKVKAESTLYCESYEDQMLE